MFLHNLSLGCFNLVQQRYARLLQILTVHLSLLKLTELQCVYRLLHLDCDAEYSRLGTEQTELVYDDLFLLLLLVD